MEPLGKDKRKTCASRERRAAETTPSTPITIAQGTRGGWGKRREYQTKIPQNQGKKGLRHPSIGNTARYKWEYGGRGGERQGRGSGSQSLRPKRIGEKRIEREKPERRNAQRFPNQGQIKISSPEGKRKNRKLSVAVVQEEKRREKEVKKKKKRTRSN